jgi:hypothetical protein
MVTAREVVGLSPTADEITWAREQTRSESHLLALVLSLKCFQRLGYFPTLDLTGSALQTQVKGPCGTGVQCRRLIPPAGSGSR